jgi:mono/diheme cytochrome c family protein
MRARLMIGAAAACLMVLAVSCRGGEGGSAAPSEGERLYNSNCATCHGANGEGIGEFPKLTGTAKILGGDYARTVIAEGRNKMPAFGSALTPAQIDEIVDYMARFK